MSAEHFFHVLQWDPFVHMWGEIGRRLAGMPILIFGYCDECGWRWNCSDPRCQEIRSGDWSEDDD